MIEFTADEYASLPLETKKSLHRDALGADACTGEACDCRTWRNEVRNHHSMSKTPDEAARERLLAVRKEATERKQNRWRTDTARKPSEKIAATPKRKDARLSPKEVRAAAIKAKHALWKQ